jgi:hypothetical protein
VPLNGENFPYLKIISGTRGMAQVVEHLPSKCEALSSNPTKIITGNLFLMKYSPKSVNTYQHVYHI